MDVTALLNEALSVASPEWWRTNWDEIIKIIMIDVVLAGDNAIVVGLAASRVAPEIRNRVIFWGIAAAVVLRILFAAVTTQLLQIIGLTLAGGLLLLWVCWKMYRQITSDEGHSIEDIENGKIAPGAQLSFMSAVTTITLADVSMSLDNVLAVAGVAKGSPLVLVFGLAIAIILMAVASRMIAELLVKFPWITWIGLLIIVWVAFEMIYSGSHEVTCRMWNFGCSETLLEGIKHRLRF
jgi:YjbE family integral membrane protein